MITETSSDTAALEELGRRIARHRLNRNLTQEALATEAGISTPTLQRMERGRPSQTSSLVRVLRALDLIGKQDFDELKTMKAGRNDPCPCGSGKKYKYCCGR